MEYFYESYDEMYEPSDADIAMEKAKKVMLDAVNAKVKSHYQNLEIENGHLVDNYKSCQKRNTELSRELIDLRQKVKEIEKEKGKITVAEFLGQRRFEMYKVDYTFEYGEKCDLCDAQRCIKYIKPSGETGYDSCHVCTDKHRVYYPKLFILQTLEEKKYNSDGVRAWFRASGSGNSYSSSEYVQNKDVYNGEPFEDCKRDKYFVNESDCQAYCDFLNILKTGEL